MAPRNRLPVVACLEQREVLVEQLRRIELHAGVDEYRHVGAVKHVVARQGLRVEQIQGPILLLSAKQGRRWPSAEMCRQMVEHLRRSAHPYALEHQVYPGGHALPSDDMVERITRCLDRNL